MPGKKTVYIKINAALSHAKFFLRLLNPMRSFREKISIALILFSLLSFSFGCAGTYYGPPIISPPSAGDPPVADPIKKYKYNNDDLTFIITESDKRHVQIVLKLGNESDWYDIYNNGQIITLYSTEYRYFITYNGVEVNVDYEKYRP